MHPNAFNLRTKKPKINIVKSQFSNINGRKHFKISSMRNNGNKITIVENVNGVMKKQVIPKKHNIFSILNSSARGHHNRHHKLTHKKDISTLLPKLF